MNNSKSYYTTTICKDDSNICIWIFSVFSDGLIWRKMLNIDF